MKLAEALALRSDAQKRFEQLRLRAQASARYQEGEKPPEDATALLKEAGDVLDQLETLIQRINRTNAATEVAPGETLTAALARRDVLGFRFRLLTDVADAASGKNQPGFGRQMRSELKYLAGVKVTEVRKEADEVARSLRDLDIKIQQANWGTDLLED